MVVECSDKELVGRTMRLASNTGFIRRADIELRDKIQLGAVLTVTMRRHHLARPLAVLDSVERTAEGMTDLEKKIARLIVDGQNRARTMPRLDGDGRMGMMDAVVITRDLLREVEKELLTIFRPKS